jgi:sulfonate transport system permease protein
MGQGSIMNTETIKKINPTGIIFPVSVILAWYFWSTSHPSLLLPPPQDTFTAIYKLLIEGKLQKYFISSMTRFSYGFFIGIFSGFLAGALISSFKWMERAFIPNVHALRLIPIVGWIPVFTIWFGMGDLPRIVIIAMGAFFPMLLNTFAGFRSVSNRYIELGDTFGLGVFEKFWRIILPSALPSIRSGTILSLTFAWTILVASEILSETNGGLSDILDIGRETFHLELVNAGILIFGLLGFILNGALVMIWNAGILRRLSNKDFR